MVEHRAFFDGMIKNTNTAYLIFIANTYIWYKHGIFDANKIKEIFKDVFDKSAPSLPKGDDGYRSYLKNVEKKFTSIAELNPAAILQDGVNIVLGGGARGFLCSCNAIFRYENKI